jgi:hypothetical protein
MTNETRSKLLGIAVLIFAIFVPLFVVFTYYVTLETTTSDMTLGIIGIFIAIGIFFGLVKLIKRRIKIKVELGLKVSPYVILLSHTLMGLVGIICFTLFLNAIQGEIDTLVYVMKIITLCEVVAFGLKFWQLHFDLKVVEDTPTE